MYLLTNQNVHIIQIIYIKRYFKIKIKSQMVAMKQSASAYWNMSLCKSENQILCCAKIVLKLQGQLRNFEDNLLAKEIISSDIPASQEGVYLFITLCSNLLQTKFV